MTDALNKKVSSRTIFFFLLVVSKGKRYFRKGYESSLSAPHFNSYNAAKEKKRTFCLKITIAYNSRYNSYTGKEKKKTYSVANHLNNLASKIYVWTWVRELRES